MSDHRKAMFVLDNFFVFFIVSAFFLTCIYILKMLSYFFYVTLPLSQSLLNIAVSAVCCFK